MREAKASTSTLAAVTPKHKTNSATVNELESQMSELNQAALLYQQNTDQKIDTLTSQNEALQTKLTKLTEALLMVNQELSQVIPRGTSAASHMTPRASQNIASTLYDSQAAASETWSQKIQSRFQGTTVYFAFAVLALLAALAAMLLRQKDRRKVTATQSASASDDDTQDEYDFMGSHEAIPAKLDLAQTYLDMGDKPAARNVLEEVIQKGDEEQQKTASELLKKTQ